MDLLPIADVAKELRLPVETVRSYGERFVLFVPAVRTGGEVRYPPEALRLLGEIDQAVEAGATFEEIELALREHVPVVVVSAGAPVAETRPASSSLDEVLGRLDGINVALVQQIDALRLAMERLTTTDQFHTLRAETAALAAALAQRDTHLKHATAVVAAELREAIAALRHDLAEIRHEVREERRQVSDLAASMASAPAQPDPAHDRPGDRSPAAERRTVHRTPRRMGQPFRVNGLPPG